MITEPIKQFQKICDPVTGDCFRACWATLLGLPIECLPAGQGERWFLEWREFFKQFGLQILYSDHCWLDEYWVASVNSLNFPDGSHAIVMKGQDVFFDPSTAKRYPEGLHLLGYEPAGNVMGYQLILTDVFKMRLLDEFRESAWKNLS